MSKRLKEKKWGRAKNYRGWGVRGWRKTRCGNFERKTTVYENGVLPNLGEGRTTETCVLHLGNPTGVRGRGGSAPIHGGGDILQLGRHSVGLPFSKSTG